MGKIIFGVIGEALSGKGELAKYLKEKLGAPSFRFSTYLRRVVNDIGIPESRENLQRLSLSIRREFGQDVIARAIIRDAAAVQAELVTVEGIRLPGDVSDLRKDPGFSLVYITAPAEVRYQRALSRGENVGEKEMTFQQFLKEESAETERMIPELGKTADFRIDNVGTLAEYHARIEEILAKVRDGTYRPGGCHLGGC